MPKGRPKGSKNKASIATPILNPSVQTTRDFYYISNEEDNIRDYLQQNQYIQNPTSAQIQAILKAKG